MPTLLCAHIQGPWTAGESTAASKPAQPVEEPPKQDSNSSSSNSTAQARQPQSQEARAAANERRAARTLQVLPVALGILESAVRFLCEGGSEGDSPPAAATPAAAVAAAAAAAAEADPQLWHNLPGAALLDLKGSLDAAFAVVLEFFGEVRPYVCGLSVHSYRMAGTVPVAAAEPVQQVSGSALQQLRTLGAACARTLGGWLAEDAGTLRDEFLAALPVILALADSSSSSSSSHSSTSGASSSTSGASSSTAAAYSSMATVGELEEVDSDDETAAGATTAWEAQQRAHAAAAAQSAEQQQQQSATSPTATAGEAQAPGSCDIVLLGLLRGLVALSYEDVALVAMVEEAVPLRTAALLERLAASVPAPPAVFAAPAARTVVSISLTALPPPYRLQPELVQPACWACALLLNTLSRGAHLPASELSAAPAPQYAVGAHPAVTAGLLLPVAGLILAGSAARHSANLAASAAAAAASSTTAAPASAAAAAAAADGLLAEGAQARLLMAYAASLLLQVARTQGASPGATLDSAALAPPAAATAGAAVWRHVAAAVAYAVRSLADPCSLNSQHIDSGEILLGRPRSSSLSSATHEDVSYEEGAMWQWAADSAAEIEAACTAEGGPGGNALVRAGVVQPELLTCLIQASESGVI
jgi:hypothetical protein